MTDIVFNDENAEQDDNDLTRSAGAIFNNLIKIKNHVDDNYDSIT